MSEYNNIYEGLIEKASYLKGFADGMGLDKQNDQNAKLLAGILELLGDISAAVEEMGLQLDAVDEDLGALEEEIYDDECDCCDDDCDCDCDCCCDDEEEQYQVTCPTCGAEFICGAEIMEEDAEVECPECGTVLKDFSVELEDEE